MKKSLALILAAMMVAGTASVAFAATADVELKSNEPALVWNSDNSCYEPLVGNTVEYGDSIAYVLRKENGAPVTEKKDATKFKVFPEWKIGSNLVSGASIEYKKVQTTEAGATLSRRTATTDKTIKGVANDAASTPRADINVTLSKANINSLDETIDKADKAATITTIEGLIEAKTADLDKLPITLDAADKTKFATQIFNELYTSDSAVREYRYVAVIKLKDSTSTKSADLAGQVKIGTTASSAKNTDGVDCNMTVENDRYNNGAELSDGETVSVTTDSEYILKFADDASVIDIEFGANGEVALFTVDCDGQSPVNVKYNTKFNADIAAKYPDANLEFVTWEATPTFNRTGDLYIYADEDTFVYEVTADGLKEISKAEYDEDYGAWKVRTRKLGSYVISDEELDVTASSSSSEASSSETSSSNPTTGGTTGTGSNTNVKPNPNTGR